MASPPGRSLGDRGFHETKVAAAPFGFPAPGDVPGFGSREGAMFIGMLGATAFGMLWASLG